MTSSHTDTDGTSFTTASVSPTANSLVLLFILAYDEEGTPEATSSITGTNWANGLTWTLETSINSAHNTEAGTAKYMVYSAVAPSSVTGGTITGNFSATHEKFLWKLVQVTDTATPDVVQSKANAGLNDVTVTLDATPDSGNGSVAFGAVSENTSLTFSSNLTDLGYIFAEGTAPAYIGKGGYTNSSPPTAALADVAPTGNTGAIYVEVGTAAASGMALDPIIILDDYTE